MQTSVDQRVKRLLRELNNYRYPAVMLFAVISIAILGLGLVWPKHYTATAILAAEDRATLQDVVKTSLGGSKLSDRAKIAQQLIFGKVIMDAIVQQDNWDVNIGSPQAREQLIESIKARTEIEATGKNLVTVSYTDENRHRAFRTAQRMASMFLRESAEAKRRETRTAFDFVDKQVKEYEAKLKESEFKLQKFKNQGFQGSEAAVSSKISKLRNDIEVNELALQEEEIRKRDLEKQLGQEVVIVDNTVKVSELQQRRNKLAQMRENLLLTLREAHPDVVEIDRRIAVLDEQLKKNEGLETSGVGAVTAGAVTTNEEGVSSAAFDALRQDLRTRISRAETTIQTLKARIRSLGDLLSKEIEIAQQIHTEQARMSELTRDYEINRDLYDQLLRKREDVRVKLHLDEAGQGLSFKTQETAQLPSTPSGLRFMYFVLAGPILGLGAPLGLVIVASEIDPRVRLESTVTEKMQLPVLTVVPHVGSPAERRNWRYSLLFIGLAVLGVSAIYMAIIVLRLSGIV